MLQNSPKFVIPVFAQKKKKSVSQKVLHYMEIQYCCFIFSTYSSFASDSIMDPGFEFILTVSKVELNQFRNMSRGDGHEMRTFK